MNLANIYCSKSWFQILQTTDKSQTAVMALEAGKSTGEQPESHRDSQQVLILINGELSAQVGKERRELTEGDVVVIPPGIPHRFVNSGKKTAVTFSVYCPPEYSPDERG
ncbi:MAG: cupin domain-containing protein [Verrucomicrobia bacterium]|nr:cupin domain-containing protein [Verrucomicrobiota bacterium]